jgi:hypothetical protein
MGNLPFWTSEGQDILEVKRQGRWVMGFSKLPYQFLATKCDLPKFKMEGDNKHVFLSNTVYYPGDIAWEELKMEFADPEDPQYSSVRTLFSIFEQAGYHPLANQNDRSFITKKRACEVTGAVKIMQLANRSIGADSNKYEEVATWTLHNAWAKSVDAGSLEYGKSDELKCAIVLRFDWATIEYPDGGQAFSKGTGII